MLQAHSHPQILRHFEEICDFIKRPPLPALGPLPVTGMHQSKFMCLCSDGSSHARIHPSAQEHHADLIRSRAHLDFSPSGDPEAEGPPIGWLSAFLLLFFTK